MKVLTVPVQLSQTVYHQNIATFIGRKAEEIIIYCNNLLKYIRRKREKE